MLESESPLEEKVTAECMQERVNSILFNHRLIDIIYLTWFLNLNSVLVLQINWFLQREDITTIIYNDPSKMNTLPT